MLQVNGIHGYYQKNGTQKLLIVVNKGGDASELKYYNDGAWTLITGANTLSSESKFEMETFIDHAFIVGATSGGSPTWTTTASLMGTTYSTATNVTGAPKARYIKVYRDLLYLVNIQDGGVNYPSRFFYSDAVTAGAITWTATNWEEVNADDGDQFMGVDVNTDRLILFKEYSAYRWDTNFIVKIADVGTTSHRSVKTVDFYTFFFNRQGIFKYAGGRPIRISAPIQPYIDGMTSSVYDVVAYTDNDHYRCFIGNTTVDDESFTNMELEYNFRTDSWTTNILKDKVLCAASYTVSNKRRIYFGSDLGAVYKRADGDDAIHSDRYVDSSSTGDPIYCEFQTKDFDGGVPELKKYFGTISVFLDRVQGVKVYYSLDKENFLPIRQLRETVSRENLEGKNCNFVSFKITESSKLKPFIFNGVVLNVKQEDSIE